MQQRIYYTYYSFETDKGIDGLGYIGSRACPIGKTPEDDNYFGSQKRDLNFKNNPKKDKIILGVFYSEEEAKAHEVYLHHLWNVDKNEHFANAAKQTSKKFFYSEPWNKGKSLHYQIWNKGKTGLQSHSDEWKKEASERNKGSKNFFYEGKIFLWENINTGEVIENTVLDMYNSNRNIFKRKQHLYSLTWFKSPKFKTYKGWKVIGCIINYGNQQPNAKVGEGSETRANKSA